MKPYRRSEGLIMSTARLLLTAALVVAGAPCLAATPQAGVAAGVSGTVSVRPADETVVKPAVGGMPIYIRDTITSAANSQMQVLLLDETVLTVGPDTEIAVDELVYDPNSAANSKLAAKISKGVFSYISGRIAEAKPENVELRLPVGTIGIRGTKVVGVEQPNGDTYIALLGPGRQNNAGLPPGGLTFSNQFGTTALTRGGFGFSVSPGGAPGPVGPIPSNLLQTLEGQLSGAANANRSARRNAEKGNTGGAVAGSGQAAAATILAGLQAAALDEQTASITGSTLRAAQLMTDRNTVPPGGTRRGGPNQR
jgi:hypothetical protein